MKSFEYADDNISERELMIAVASMIIGISVLTLSRKIAIDTVGSDGWITILVGGIIIILITWLAAKLASLFPNQTFLTYATTIVGRPIAMGLTFVFVFFAVFVVTYEVRMISDISKLYLFGRTPLEVLALTFLLVVVYAVSGSRAGIFRLNIMFLPIIVTVTIIIIIFNIKLIELDDFLPVFKTDITGYLKGTLTNSMAYAGFSIVLFYVALLKNPKKAPKMAALGIIIPMALYLLVFLTTIGVFGHMSTSNLIYPTIELAKRVEIPGQLFERIDSIFFVIWIMAIFNTAAMALDIAVLAINSIFKNTAKLKIIFIFSPLIYFLSMFPENVIQVTRIAQYIGNFSIPFTLSITILLLSVAKIKGVKSID